MINRSLVHNMTEWQEGINLARTNLPNSVLIFSMSDRSSPGPGPSLWSGRQMVVEEEDGGWQSLTATPLVPRSQVRLLEVAVTNQSRRSGTRNTDFSDTATNSSFDGEKIRIVLSLISTVMVIVHFVFLPTVFFNVQFWFWWIFCKNSDICPHFQI